MLIASLLCNPQSPSLAPPRAEAVRAAWGGGPLRWLAEGEAVEFALEAEPDDLWQVWAALQEEGIDLAVQPQAGRRKAMLIADMDSTMIEQECIDELAAMAGFGDHVAAITARAMNGELAFEPALRERVALLRGLPVSIIDQVLARRITYRAGGRALVATMQAQGGFCVLVSGGFTAFTERVSAELGFDAQRANRLDMADGHLTGTVAAPILGREAKLHALHEFAAERGLVPEQVMAVGDGANDLAMLGAAGAGVALHAKPSVAAQCRLRINHGDLTALLYLQGYARGEFVLR
ncbi:MAG: phosphoserine phosphatase SerB [Pararhodobacter sp.]|nr:phosphoserine phosphatase SerB [Pararhodobacter sp.]